MYKVDEPAHVGIVTSTLHAWPTYAQAVRGDEMTDHAGLAESVF